MTQRVAALDGIRALAILLVMFHHAVLFVGGATTRPEQYIARVASEGWIGVDLFFVLSGYLITGILLRTKHSAGYFRNFIVRRILRIFPAYYLFLLVFFVVLPRLCPYAPELSKLPAQQAWYWSYLPNVKIFLDGDWDAHYVEHAWSLAIEEQFYLIWPVVVALCSRRALLIVCAVGAPLSLGLRIFLIASGAGRAAAFVLMPSHLDGLMLGAILAAVAPELAELRPRAVRMLAGAATLGIGSLAAIPSLPLSFDMKHHGLAVTSWSLIFMALVGVTVVSSERSWLVRLLSARPLALIGSYSYGLYLWHQPLFRVLAVRIRSIHSSALGQWSIMLVGGGLLSFGLAALLYETFEKRFLSLKRHFEPGAQRLAPRQRHP